MYAIWKFPIEAVADQQVSAPAGARPLCVGLDPGGTPCLWCLVDTERAPEPLTVCVFGTGESVGRVSRSSYVGSIVWGSIVMHVFAGR